LMMRNRREGRRWNESFPSEGIKETRKSILGWEKKKRRKKPRTRSPINVREEKKEKNWKLYRFAVGRNEGEEGGKKKGCQV